MHQTPRLLIVDDSPENLSILGELLSGYHRNFATDGIQALQQLRTQILPDLVLLDVVMPGVDGFEVCRRMKSESRLRDIPVIFITSLAEGESEARGFEIGAVDYIAKPFNPVVVRARVKTHLELTRARKALARQNLLLEEQVAERTSELTDALSLIRRSSLETILRLSRAAEYKDPCTGEHVLRMSRYCAAIARHLGFGDTEVNLILHAAPMHDIGKIGITDQILLKAGRLTPEERRAMEQHTIIGATILTGSDSDVIRAAEIVALSHHERWDGGGYPHGLRGSGIPLYGRIVAVADVFDALTSKRSYKEAFPDEEAISMIGDVHNGHFDPEIVDAFMGAKNEILTIKESFRNAVLN